MQVPMFYELWFSTKESGALVGCLQAVDGDGKRRLVDSEEFGPFDGPKDVAGWAWRKLIVDLGGTVS